MKRLLSCEFNFDTVCMELKYSDGAMIAIDTIAVENEVRSDMQSKEKAVTVFRFKYKQKEYFVAVCLLTDEDRKKQVADFALVRLCFMRADNIEMYLDCYANSKDITAGITQLRYFFGC